MESNKRLSRRGLLAGTAGVVAAAATGWSGSAEAQQAERRRGGRQRKPWDGDRVVVNDRINQSVCDWCFLGDCSSKPVTLEELCKNAAAMGIKSVELVQPADWPILKKYGLVNALAPSHMFVEGWNHKENWEMCGQAITTSVDACADAGFPSVITFSGFRKEMSDEEGLENTVAGLKTVIGHAEKKGVTLILEMLNSRVDIEMKGHPGYMGDSIEWCVEVCKKVGSQRLKILFDVYHVQIMQGDIITRINQYSEYIGHYHTAGVPGRNEIDRGQEINYPPIMRAILKTGYEAYVAQEFIPTRDPMTSLAEAVRICDV